MKPEKRKSDEIITENKIIKLDLNQSGPSRLIPVLNEIHSEETENPVHSKGKHTIRVTSVLLT